MTVYLDTSAAAKLVKEESESAALAEWMQQPDVRASLVSSFFLHTELHCAAARRAGDFPVDAVRTVLSAVELVDVERADLVAAATLPGRLRSADAIHLATSVRVAADTMVVYDEELAAAARSVGLRVVAPS